MSQQDYKFEGWLGHDKASADGNMTWGSWEPKKFEENDIDIEITHSGVCGSDVHTLRSGWYPTPYPVCVGHEIVGKVVRVGSEVEGGIKLGDRVGVGAQGDSCLGRHGNECSACSDSRENYCPRMVGTYASKHYSGDKSMGGYGKYHRVPSHFAIKIPDEIDSADAAPMLCGGVTTYSPLKEFGCGPGKTVGVVGVGGLGHFAVLWAKALGADRVVGISRSSSKRDDSLKLGCDEYIATKDDADWAKKHASSLDLIISTISSTDTSLGDYLALLKYDGTLVQVGNPDDGPFSLPPMPLILKRARVVGSCIGSPSEIREMFALAVEKNIKPWVEQRPMKEANQVLKDLNDGKARYRYCLIN